MESKSKKQRKEELEKQLQLQELKEYKKQIELEKRRVERLIGYDKAEKSLYEYHKLSWNIHVPQPFIDNWHIGAICDHLQALSNRELKNLIINLPPRCAKSSICSISFPTWTWINNPQEQFMTTSYSDEIVLRDSLRSRQVIMDEWYQEGWGNKFELKKDVNQKGRYENNVGGYRMASTIGAGKQLGEGYTCLIVDDPLKANEAFSRLACQKVIDWWKYTMSTRANSSDAVRLIIMQRLSEMDLVEHILKNEMEDENWYHLCLPMRYETKPKYFTKTPLKFIDPRTKDGELLCPKYMDEIRVRVLESKLGEYGTAAQLQQRPAPVGGGLIKESFFRQYAAPISKYSYPSLFFYIFASWDFNFGEENQGEDNSYCVGQVWGVGKDGKYYLLYQLRDKWEFLEQIDAVKRLNRLYPEIRYNLIEEMASGAGVINSLKKELSQYNVIGVKPKDFGFLKGNNDKGKVMRLNAYLSVFEANRVWLPSERISPWIKDYVQELITFPAAKHDDQLDATVLALMWIEKKGLTQGISAKVTEDLLKEVKEQAYYRPNDVQTLTRVKSVTKQAINFTSKDRNYRDIF